MLTVDKYFIVKTQEGSFAGYGYLVLSDDKKSAEVGFIDILPEHQGNNLGQLIRSSMQDWALDNGVIRLTTTINGVIRVSPDGAVTGYDFPTGGFASYKNMATSKLKGKYPQQRIDEVQLSPDSGVYSLNLSTLLSNDAGQPILLESPSLATDPVGLYNSIKAWSAARTGVPAPAPTATFTVGDVYKDSTNRTVKIISITPDGKGVVIERTFMASGALVTQPVQYPNKADLTKYLADNKYVLSSSYTFGNDAYKDTFTITDPSGNVVGQHGIEMAPSINTPKQVQSFNVYLAEHATNEVDAKQITTITLPGSVIEIQTQSFTLRITVASIELDATGTYITKLETRHEVLPTGTGIPPTPPNPIEKLIRVLEGIDNILASGRTLKLQTLQAYLNYLNSSAFLSQLTPGTDLVDRVVRTISAVLTLIDQTNVPPTGGTGATTTTPVDSKTKVFWF